MSVRRSIECLTNLVARRLSHNICVGFRFASPNLLSTVGWVKRSVTQQFIPFSKSETVGWVKRSVTQQFIPFSKSETVGWVKRSVTQQLIPFSKSEIVGWVKQSVT
ncbi:hypothetical protein Dacsa_3626 [Dactylococcopsis salina PCC 8305]|uniref:Uncharacterized protein n=1 Tax=Dactylococcopsis salina (strain PCC 8305) TaxID=13035 RepID=K9YYT0_DACS8|nr:hypothetical protein Dacsa_3626 [Dactylococcopsis salina PCC 8305]